MKRIILQLLILCLSASFFPRNVSAQTNQIDPSQLVPGAYNHGYFESESRGRVNFNVYLPPDWSKDNAGKYPLLILLHGQGGNEYSLPATFTAPLLTQWINIGVIPEMVVIATNGGIDPNAMQWFTADNVEMITSEKQNELRWFCATNFNTTRDSGKISLLGHSRGAAGTLYFAVHYPDKFASAVSAAYVSDYMIYMLQQVPEAQLDKIRNSGIGIRMLIGTMDEFDLIYGRKGSYLMDEFFDANMIPHEFYVFENRTHNPASLLQYPTNLEAFEFVADSWNRTEETELSGIISSEGGSSSARFTAGAYREGSDFTSTEFIAGDTVRITATVIPQAEDVAKPGQIFMVMESDIDGVPVYTYQDEDGVFHPWSRHAAELEPFRVRDELSGSETFEIYNGTLAAGSHRIYLGYATSDQGAPLHFNSIPYRIDVSE